MVMTYNNKSNILSFELSAIAVAPMILSRDIEKLKNASEQPEVRDFIGFTKDYFEQALADLKNGDVDGCLINFQHLKHQAKRAQMLQISSDKTFILTQLMILSDVILHSTLPSEKGTIIIPPIFLNNNQREAISNTVKEDCDKPWKGPKKQRGEKETEYKLGLNCVKLGFETHFS